MLSVEIQDDGVGFNPDHPLRKGMGLVGIRERVRQLGGTLAIASQPQKGTILKVGRKYLTVDFGLTGIYRVHERDLLGHGH